MLRITQQSVSAAAKAYYSRPDYYIDGQERAGVWGGMGAARLALEGEIRGEAFHALCDNLLPDGSGPLTARSRSERTVGYDFTFNVPKSVSLVATLTKDAAITAAVEAAVEETMREVEGSMQTRVRRRGVQADRTTGNVVWGRFTHFTTRPVDGVPDPHLHVHVFAFNATYDAAEERWKAGQFRGLKRDARYYEAAFHARLAGKMRDLGYGIERTATGSGWEIAGFEKPTLDRFSRRTALIEKTAQEKGITNPDDKAALGAKTRAGKDKSLGMDELQAEWLGRLDETEKAALDAVAAKTVGDRGPIYVAKDAMAWAVGHAFTRMAVLREKALLAFALRQGVGGVSVEEMWQELAGHGILTRKDG
jgi:conjugative relaxase-like TrwC/TraI family protein